jgi:hypothetical protein
VRLEVACPDHVVERHDLATLAQRDDERFVHDVLDRRTGTAGADDRELAHLLFGQVVRDLVEIALERPLPSVGRRVTNLVDPVDTTGTQQRRIEHVRQVGRHDHEDAVLRRRLRTHPECPAHVAVEDAARLLQTGQLRQQRLQGPHAAAACVGHHDEATSPTVVCRWQPFELGAQQLGGDRRGHVADAVAAVIEH